MINKCNTSSTTDHNINYISYTIVFRNVIVNVISGPTSIACKSFKIKKSFYASWEKSPTFVSDHVFGWPSYKSPKPSLLAAAAIAPKSKLPSLLLLNLVVNDGEVVVVVVVVVYLLEEQRSTDLLNCFAPAPEISQKCQKLYQLIM